MNIGKFDVMVLVVMSLAVVAMSFVFPALGLSDTDTDESEIPELDITADRFDFAGELPRFPNTATEGTLWFNTTEPASFSENRIWLEGNTEGGYELLIIQNVSDPNTADVVLNRWNSSGTVNESDEIQINDNNTQGVLSAGEYEVAIEESPRNDPPDYLEVEWNIVQQSQAGGSWVGRLPGVGALLGAGEAVASILAWAVTVFIWFSQSLVQGSLNALGVVFDASAYFISLLTWLITTYSSVVSSAPSWTSIFVALPGIILSVTLGKIVVIFIGLLPTT